MSPSDTIPNEEVTRLAEKEEPRFLGILLRDKDCIADAISYGIAPTPADKPGHFLYEKNSYFYQLIYKNYIKYGTLLTRSAIDSIMDMQESGNAEQRSSMKTYWDLIWGRHDIDKEDYGLLRDHINERYILWQFWEKWKNGNEIIKAISNHGEIIKGFIHDINAIRNLEPDAYSLTMGAEEGFTKAIAHVTERRENPVDVNRIKTGLKVIDDIYNGFEKGSYTVVSGMINGGKTTFLMNVAFNMAMAGYNVAYVSLEKKAELFFRRLLALHASTDYNRIKRGGKEEWGITEHWYGKLKAAAQDLINNVKPHLDCLQFVQQTKLTKILSDVDKIRTSKKIDVLIVDYLGVIGFETHTIGRPDLDLANVHQRIMAYGRTHNLVTFTALQLKSSSSKDIRKKAQKVGTDADISSVEVNTEDYSGSQMIVADADNAIGCVLNSDHPPTKMYISVSKARDDESRRTVVLDFDGKLGRVADPEYTPQQIKATQDLLYNSNVDSDLLEKKLTSDDDLFNAVSDSEGANVSDVAKLETVVETAPDIITELDQGIEAPKADKTFDPMDIEDIEDNVDEDDGNIDDVFGVNELGE